MGQRFDESDDERFLSDSESEDENNMLCEYGGDGGDSDFELDKAMERDVAQDIIDYVFYMGKGEAHIDHFNKGMVLFSQNILRVILDKLYELEETGTVIRIKGTDIWKSNYDYGEHSVIRPDEFQSMEYPGVQPFSMVDYHEECAKEYMLTRLHMYRQRELIRQLKPSEIYVRDTFFHGLWDGEIHEMMKDLPYIRCGNVYFKRS